MDLTVKEVDMVWLQSCYVGQVNNPNAVHLLQDRLIDEGIFNFTVTPMGGDLVLIKPVEGEDFVEFVKNYEDLVEMWFYDLRPWSPGDVAREREAWIRCEGLPIHAWSNHIFESLVACLGSFISTDTNTMEKKRLDVARVLIRTSSWEAVNRVIKVRINGVFFNVRLLEEPFPEYTFRSTRKEGDNVCSSSCLESTSWVDLDVGSGLDDYFDSVEEDFELENQFEAHEAPGGDGVGGVQSNVEANEGPINPINVSIIGFNAGVHVSGTKEANSLHGEGQGHREIQVVDHSADLVVDLELGPAYDFGVGPTLNQIGQASESDPISSWVGPQADGSNQRNGTLTPSINLGGGPSSAMKFGVGVGSEGVPIQGMANVDGACDEGNRQNIEEIVSKDLATETISAKIARFKVSKNGVKNGGKYRCKIPKGLNKQGTTMGASRKQARRTISKRILIGTTGNLIPSCCSSSSISCWKNCLLGNETPAAIANGVWDFGKSIGLQCEGPESEVVKELASIEVRDREAAGRNGNR